MGNAAQNTKTTKPQYASQHKNVLRAAAVDSYLANSCAIADEKTRPLAVRKEMRVPLRRVQDLACAVRKEHAGRD